MTEVFINTRMMIKLQYIEYQINTGYTLNLHNAMYQLYL